MNISEVAVQAQTVAMIEAIAPASWAVHTLGQIQAMAVKPKRYLEVHVARRYIPALRFDPGPDQDAFIVMVGAVSDTENNARRMLGKARLALDYQRITVDGVESDPLEPQAARPVARDEGEWSGLDAWNTVF